MTLLREAIGDSLRRARLAQSRTLREVSTSARVSLGYLSEVERGRKEASSELLAAICAALDVPLSRVLWDVSAVMAGIDGMPVADGSFDAAAAIPDDARTAAAAASTSTEAAESTETAGEPAAASASAHSGGGEHQARPLPLAGATRIVIPAPKADMLVLVKGA
ncbi:helix-turn-helix domain-containing protein [Nocardia callitridis]|uniref:HTH cro/C1-type domain-containing protein n=1 Tax=Nocardia callitridis TaxID=648753 RepID=A0ABP9KC16_9NOCA